MVDLKTAKSRADYRFTQYITEEIRKELMTKWPGGPEAYNDLFDVYAVLELGYVDIELNLFPDDSALSGYFICVKRGDGPHDWESDDYADSVLGDEGIVNVDWSAENWSELLEADMFRVLSAYVDKVGYSIDKPNR